MKKYLEDALNLVSSLIIKMDISAVHTNMYLAKQFKITVGTDKREWKYYKNLNGEYYYTDKPVLFKYENEELVLTKELLLENKFLHRKLQEKGVLFDNIILANKQQSLLVNGIINPIDKELAIESSDGTILFHDRKYVRGQEFTLIPNIEKSIDHFLHRWSNDLYMLTDDLYVPSVLSQVYNLVFLEIIKHRTEKINSFEVNEQHMLDFFISNFHISEELDVLTPNSKMWLYRNLNYIKNNIGKNRILDALVENIATPSGIMVSDVEVSVTTIDNPKSSLYVIPRNLNYFKNGRKEISYTELLTKQLTNFDITETLLSDNLDRHHKELELALIENKHESLKTKTIIVGDTSVTKFSNVDRSKTILDLWVKAVHNNHYASNKVFIDPNTNISYTLTQKQGLYLSLMMLGKICGRDIIFDEYEFTTCIDPDKFNSSNLLFNICNNDIIDFLNTLEFNTISVLTDTDITETIKDSISNYDKIWKFESQLDNPILSSNLSRLIYDSTRETIISLDSGDAIEVLKTMGVELLTNESYNYSKSVQVLVKLFTGHFMSLDEKVASDIGNMAKLLNKLTPYTTQIVTTELNENVWNSSSGLDIYSGSNLSLINDITFEGLENYNVDLNASGFDVGDFIDVFDIRYYDVNFTKKLKLKTFVSDYSVPENTIEVDRPNFGISFDKSFIEHTTTIKARGNLQTDNILYIPNTPISICEHHSPSLVCTNNDEFIVSFNSRSNIIKTTLTTTEESISETDVGIEIVFNDYDDLTYKLEDTTVRIKFNEGQ